MSRSLPHPSAGSSLGSRRDELNAAFGAGADADDLSPRVSAPTPPDGPPGYNASEDTSAAAANHSSDVFFDAGEAMGEEPSRPARQIGNLLDPLGASRNDDDGDDDNMEDGELLRASPSLSANRIVSRGTSQGGYDFERPSHFGATPSRSASNGLNSSGVTSSHPYGAGIEASSSRTALDSSSPLSIRSTQTGGVTRARRLLGRFGRFVGMRVPGAAYSSIDQEEINGTSPRRRVMGGGLGSDGVFANLNAKPETRRRRANNGGPEDRGEDDDLAEDILPPTYEVAAADAAPGYWETTIAPGGLGWTPGGGNVGDLEDLILEGLPIGNVFGFAWNLLVSMCFQFVGFLLTYLLHTTHAARCGSRAGLGVTLIQYGFYLRTRALQLAEDGVDGASGSTGNDVEGGGLNPPQTVDWFGNALVYTRPTQTAAVRDLLTATATSTASATLATALASDADGRSNSPSGSIDNAGTSEWLAYALMVIGWVILLSSVLSYFRIHRWGRALIAASRREQESTRAAENGGETPEVTEANAPVGFIHRLMAMMGPPQSRSDGRSTGTGEDWVVYPGASANVAAAVGLVGVSSNTPTVARSAHENHRSAAAVTPIWGAPPRTGTLAYPALGDDHDQDDDGDDSRGHISPEEEELMSNMRRAGLL